MSAPNFARLDSDRPEITRLMIAMLQAREALSGRSWSHPLEYAGEEWWADVLADPRARRQAEAATAVALRTSTGCGTNHAQSSWRPAPSAIGRQHTAAMNSPPCTVPIAPCQTCSTILPVRGV